MGLVTRTRRSNAVNIQSSLFLAAIFLLPVFTCHSQALTNPAAPPPPIDLKPNPLATLSAFEPPANQPYELGRGDEITVEAIGRPELTAKHVIGPDGEITLPLVGSIKIADKTREEAAAQIQTALSAYYSGVTIAIAVDRYTSNQILLLGAVQHPGVMTFDKTPTLLEVVSRGGVQPDTPSTGGAGPKPAGVPEECLIYRGSETMVTVELKALLDEGSPLANMRLKRDDVVYVTGRTKYVSVLGQVTHPGNLQLENTSTLADLLAQVGGPTEKAGRNPDIQIIHRAGTHGSTRTQTVPFNTLLARNSFDLSLQSGDIIFVKESGFNGAAYTLEKIAPLINLFTVAAVLDQE